METLIDETSMAVINIREGQIMLHKLKLVHICTIEVSNQNKNSYSYTIASSYVTLHVTNSLSKQYFINCLGLRKLLFSETNTLNVF